jgi:hypothetical protein
VRPLLVREELQRPALDDHVVGTRTDRRVHQIKPHTA